MDIVAFQKLSYLFIISSNSLKSSCVNSKKSYLILVGKIRGNP